MFGMAIVLLLMAVAASIGSGTLNLQVGVGSLLS